MRDRGGYGDISSVHRLFGIHRVAIGQGDFSIPIDARIGIDDAGIILKPDNQSGNFGDIDVSKVECAIQGKVLLE